MTAQESLLWLPLSKLNEQLMLLHHAPQQRQEASSTAYLYHKDEQHKM